MGDDVSAIDKKILYNQSTLLRKCAAAMLSGPYDLVTKYTKEIGPHFQEIKPMVDRIIFAWLGMTDKDRMEGRMMYNTHYAKFTQEQQVVAKEYYAAVMSAWEPGWEANVKECSAELKKKIKSTLIGWQEEESIIHESGIRSRIALEEMQACRDVMEIRYATKAQKQAAKVRFLTSYRNRLMARSNRTAAKTRKEKLVMKAVQMEKAERAMLYNQEEVKTATSLDTEVATTSNEMTDSGELVDFPDKDGMLPPKPTVVALPALEKEFTLKRTEHLEENKIESEQKESSALPLEPHNQIDEVKKRLETHRADLAKLRQKLRALQQLTGENKNTRERLGRHRAVLPDLFKKPRKSVKPLDSEKYVIEVFNNRLDELAIKALDTPVKHHAAHAATAASVQTDEPTAHPKPLTSHPPTSSIAAVSQVPKEEDLVSRFGTLNLGHASSMGLSTDHPDLHFNPFAET